MKKGLKSLAVLGLSVLGLVGCGGNNSKLVVGLVSVGDTSETYSKAHIDGIRNAAAKHGVEVVLKTSIPESSAVVDSANEIIEQGASVVFTNSYGHQDYAYEVAKNNKDITVVAATGDYAAISGLTNFKNAFTNIYEARYVSGIVGGMKLKELVDGNKLTTDNQDSEGNWKIGYVGAFNYAEVVSGYTAFYLGVKAGFGADNVVMDVQYTDSWYDHDGENAAAQSLISRGNVIIGQHADSTGAPEAIEAAHKTGKEVYSVGYNVDMLSAAPTAALTSATNNWEKYYDYAIETALNGGTIATDWAKGYNDSAVAITTLGP
nr:BMP family ABC transporter substrate-binding protein [Bacilli bacterium]